ncbi:hypothetical protein [Novosphingobium sp. M1R2S20]|uniref:Uncharacterized protein n=1 Tax=Novosphingobium rhizovicinum TaxID=3228928 RepID=A0ABV3RCR5_9SPHN
MRWYAIVAVFAVAGCDDIPRARSENAIRGIAAEEAVKSVQRMDVRLARLEEENRKLKGDMDLLRDWLKAESDALESLRKTFNHNVNLENSAKVARMTAQGACGTERVEYPDGGWAIRNKECTQKDLK